MTGHRQVVISGGGPSGLAAAMLFHRLGWQDIVLVERRSSPEDFEKNKAFNYLVDARGQKLLRQLGIRDLLYEFGVETTVFKAIAIGADGAAKSVTPPIIDPNRPVAFWTTRRNLLTMLYNEVGKINDGRITLLYDHKVERLESGDDGAAIVISDQHGSQRRYSPDLVLACDGLNSAVRTSLSEQSGVPQGHFDMVQHPSLSSGLTYKVLNLPATFTTRDGQVALDDHRMSYIISSRHKDRRRACSLFAFPVANPNHPRSVNLIREADHVLWTLETAEDLLDFLEDSFPQLDIRALIPHEEAKDFASLEPGRFPVPQYARHISRTIGPPCNPMHCVLIGDSAHAFPPDLGMGVNSALEDLLVLGRYLESSDDLAVVCRTFENERLADNKALVKLVQTVFPEQYNHRPLRMIVWLIGFTVRRLLHRVVPGLVGRPAFLLTQDPDLRFTEMLANKRRTDMVVRGLGVLIGLAILLAAINATGILG